MSTYSVGVELCKMYFGIWRLFLLQCFFVILAGFFHESLFSGIFNPVFGKGVRSGCLAFIGFSIGFYAINS